MIDWFASKIGLLVFIVAALSLLLMFANFQLDIMENSRKVNAANDLARLADGLCEGCSIGYRFERNYTVSLGEGSITVEDVSRATLSELAASSMRVGAVTLEKTGGKVVLHGV